MNRLELVKVIREILSNAGFYVSDLYSMRPIGFDLVARRDNSLLIIKVLTNINALSEDVASELKLLSKLLKGQPLLIGERGGTGYLEKDVVYDRFGIQTISLDTLESYLLDGTPIKIYAAPGGFYVRSVSLDPWSLQRGGAFNCTLRADWHDEDDGDAGDYTCVFNLRSPSLTEYGPYTASVTKEESKEYNGTFVVDPGDSWEVGKYDIKADVVRAA